MLDKKYIENIKSNIGMQLINIFISFIISTIVARELGAKNYGEISYIILIINIVSGYYHLGIINGSALMYKVKKDRKITLSSNIMFCFISLSLLLSILFIFRNNIFVNIDNQIFWLMCFGILLLSLFKVLNLYYISQERIKEMSQKISWLKLLYGILVILLFIAKKITVKIYFLSYLSYLLLQFFLLWIDKNEVVEKQIDFKILKKEFQIGFWIFLGAFFIFINYRVDQLFIKYYLGNELLGIYTVAVNLSELLFIVSASVSTSLLGSLINKNKKYDKYKLVEKTLKITSILIILLIFIGILMRPLIPIIYGNDYDLSKDIIIILFIGNFFANIGKIISSYFISEGKTYIHALICFTIMLVNIGLNFIFIKNLEIYGAALASCISYLIYGIIYYIFFKREVKEYENRI